MATAGVKGLNCPSQRLCYLITWPSIT